MVKIPKSGNLLPNRTTLGANGFKYIPKFGLLIETKTEEEQRIEYERLAALGYKPRVLVV